MSLSAFRLAMLAANAIYSECSDVGVVTMNRTALTAMGCTGHSTTMQNVYKLSGGNRPQIVNYFAASHQWVEFAMPTFDLTHSLFYSLVATDVSDVQLTDLAHPFPAWLLRIPDDQYLRATERDGSTSSSTMILVFAHREPPLGSLTVGDIVSGSARLGDLLFSRGAQTGDEAALQRIDQFCSSERASLHVLPVIDGHAVLHSVDQPSTKSVRQLAHCDEDDFSIIDRQSVAKAWALVANVCMYIAANGRGEPAGKSRGRCKAAKASGVVPRPEIWVLGRSVKIPRPMREAIRGAIKTGRGYELTKRFTVRGHFRNQPCGPGRAARKTVYIEPYWKGPATSEAYVKLLSVEERKKARVS